MNLNITEKRSELMGRDSNLELFRILSMLVIVAHHYVVNSGLLECIDAQTKLQLKTTFRSYLAGAARLVSIALF